MTSRVWFVVAQIAIITAILNMVAWLAAATNRYPAGTPASAVVGWTLIITTAAVCGLVAVLLVHVAVTLRR